ncbi:carboxylating nicotinate-nucleotide diphosphorylase [candidate division KSB1 bacterium]|nr:carboxylating nicotinate-nucleotide diphosphorylase [candidate division KSB1 bacterium]
MESFQGNHELISFLKVTLREDLSHHGDITTLATVPEDLTGEARIISRGNAVIAGQWIAEMVFKNVEPRLVYQNAVEDGTKVLPNTVISRISGPVRGILTGERSALNFLARLSGVATITNQFVEKISGTGAKILDTRKTTPGLRFLEKYAVKVGGGHNHRFGLSDMFLIKENHIKAAGGITPAVEKCHAFMHAQQINLKIEVETTNLNEVQEALKLKVDRIMLDNMSVEMIKEAVRLVDGKVELEASGGINALNVRDYALTGINYISIGALTHSAPIADLTLLLD